MGTPGEGTNSEVGLLPSDTEPERTVTLGHEDIKTAGSVEVHPQITK